MKSVSTTSIFSIFDHEVLQDRFFLSDPTTVGHKDQIAWLLTVQVIDIPWPMA
jgi:hypothetical protein